MTIRPIHGDGAAGAARPDRPEPEETAARIGPVAHTEPARPVDQVEISPEARLLARLAELADELGMEPGDLRTIQDRLAGGFYQKPGTLDRVAVRLLASGDLGGAGEPGS